MAEHKVVWREIYDSYLRELRADYPQYEPLMRAAIDAFDSIQGGKPITEHLLQPIVEAASDPRKLLYEIAVEFLDQLTEKYDEACEAVAKMAVDSRSHIRFNAIMCIGKEAHEAFKLRLLRQGLRDKNPKVRWKAADWASRHGIKKLVPDVEGALAAEKNAKAKASIEYTLNLLRDG